VPILHWRCAHGEAPAVTLPCWPVVPLSPRDDAVDSNTVRIVGEGVIWSFGEGCWITKRVIFPPGVTLKQNPPYLELLTFADRFIDVPAIGIYACDGASHWGEIHFMETGARELTRRLDAIEARLAGIEARVGKEKAPAR